MKISKEYLKKLIKEEISKISEGDGEEKTIQYDLNGQSLTLILTDGILTHVLDQSGNTVKLSVQEFKALQQKIAGHGMDQEPVSAYK